MIPNNKPNSSRLPIQVHLDFSLADHVFGRIYYVVCTGTDLIQTIAKISMSIFATSFAILCLGQSAILNRVHGYFWQDTYFSVGMLFQSMKGIADPIDTYNTKAQLHINNTIEVKATDMNILENCLVRLIFAANMIKEIVITILSVARFAVSLTMYLASLGSARGIGIITLGALVSTIRSIAMTSTSFAGIFAPQGLIEDMQ